MNDKLECLRKLQEVLREKFSLEDQVKSIPAHLNEESEKLEKAEENYKNLSDKLAEIVQEHKSLAIRYEDASAQKISYEKQVEFINTQREFEALAKQLEEAKTLEQSLLKQRDSKDSEEKAMEKEVRKASEELDSQRAIVEEERGKVEGKLDEMTAKIRELEEECEAINGIVPVHGQVCMGCDRVLPMQFVIDLRLKQQSNEIEYCPYCSRIIYKEELDEDMEKAYTFEQLEPSKAEGKSQDKKQQDDSQGDDDSGFDSTLGGDFEGF